MIVTGSFDLVLVVLSVVTATAASYTALDLADRIHSSTGRSRQGWLAAAAVAMGGGIWSMHFIAMLAFATPMPVTYDISLTALSFLVAVIVTGAAFILVSSWQAAWQGILLGGIFMGSGICSMHYIGMAAMRMPAELHYDRALVGLSFLIAASASVVSLWLAARTRHFRERAAGAIAMGIAISGMHYTGMAAATFAMPDVMTGAMISPVETVGGLSPLAQVHLALAVAATTFLILFFAGASSVVDRRLATAAAREADLLRDSEQRFRTFYHRTPIPMQSLAEDGRLLNVSDYWTELLGYRRDEVVGRPIVDFMTEASGAKFREAWPKIVGNSEMREAEFEYVKKSGDVVDALISARIERDSAGRFVQALAVLVDVTERKRLQAQLVEAQKMEVVGQLTGGIAHGFNNVLTAGLGSLDLLARQLEKQPRLQRSVTIAARAMTRAARTDGYDVDHLTGCAVEGRQAAGAR